MLIWGGMDTSLFHNETLSYTPNSGGFAITRVFRNGEGLTISFPTVVGCTYTLLGSDILADGTWTNTGLASIAGTGAVLSFTVPAMVPSRFSRVHAIAP